MKRGQGALQEQQTQSKVGVMVCKRCFNAIFLQGIEKDLQMQRTPFLQGIAVASVPKRYNELKVCMQSTVDHVK